MKMTRFVAILTAVNLAMLITLFLGAAPAGTTDVTAATVRARSIELVDRDGNVRAQLYVDNDGGGRFRLRGGNGDVRVKLGASVDGAALVLMDKNSEPGVRLGTDNRGPSLRLVDADKTEKVIEP